MIEDEYKRKQLRPFGAAFFFFLITTIDDPKAFYQPHAPGDVALV